MFDFSLMFKILFIYYFFINLFLFLAMGIDKYKAIKNKWRIQESSLFLISFMGGFIGLALGMRTFRHKIRKNKFYIVLALSTILHIFLVYNLIRL